MQNVISSVSVQITKSLRNISLVFTFLNIIMFFCNKIKVDMLINRNMYCTVLYGTDDEDPLPTFPRQR
jgi:hypothetical protein